jgi:hypothetical protein
MIWENDFYNGEPACAGLRILATDYPHRRLKPPRSRLLCRRGLPEVRTVNPDFFAPASISVISLRNWIGLVRPLGTSSRWCRSWKSRRFAGAMRKGGNSRRF